MGKVFILVTCLILCLNAHGAGANAMSAEEIADAIDETPENEIKYGGKILDTGEPTPKEKSQMERERVHRGMQEEGFDGSMQEMAEGDPEAFIEFGLND